MRKLHAACAHVTARLSDYLESQLSPGDEQTVRTHLSSCPDCRLVLHDLQRTIKLLSQIPKPRAPQHLIDTILQDQTSDREDQPGS